MLTIFAMKSYVSSGESNHLLRESNNSSSLNTNFSSLRKASFNPTRISDFSSSMRLPNSINHTDDKKNGCSAPNFYGGWHEGMYIANFIHSNGWTWNKSPAECAKYILELEQQNTQLKQYNVELEKKNAELKSIVSQLKNTQIQVKQKNKELTFLATHDPLTGCLNRRSFYEQFEALFNSAQANHSDLSCLMIDIDHFKSINDNHGHARGDEIIKMVANVLKSSTRQADLVGRYGGEEFCVVLPGTTQEVALKIAERIRIKIFKESGATVSIGLSTMHDQPKNAEDLNHKSDEALYVAKRSGRNMVVEWRN